MDVPIALILLAVFLNRYVFGLYARMVCGRKSAPRSPEVDPTVTIVVPMYNQGASIRRTIASLAALDYPPEKRRIIIVDDCSTDGSADFAREAAKHFANVRLVRNPHNMGKRLGICRVVRGTQSDFVLSVDSDVIVDRGALRALLAEFTDDQVGAVGGRVHVSNPNANWLTRVQTIKYYFGQEHIKNLERAFEQVMCLSGCLTAHRREALLAVDDIITNRHVLGVAIKYGEDRFLTRQLVKAGYRTKFTTRAWCFTEAVTSLQGYFNQQLRWKRSNLIDFALGLGHTWRLHPLVMFHYLTSLMMLLAYPFVLAQQLLLGNFVAVAATHLLLIAGFGCIYAMAPTTRALPKALRVHPLAFLPMAVLMPAAYLVLTPLALFTLDSSSWETRGHSLHAQPRRFHVEKQSA